MSGGSFTAFALSRVGTFAGFVLSAPQLQGAPENEVAPVISGTLGIGEVLSCTTGTWSDSPESYAYQWQAGNADIVGETASTYTQTGDTLGSVITCNVTATNGAGTSDPATSNALQWTMVELGAISHLWRSTQSATRYTDLAGTTPASSGDALGNVTDEVGAIALIASSIGTRPDLETVSGIVTAAHDGLSSLMIAASTALADEVTIIAICSWDTDTLPLDSTSTSNAQRVFLQMQSDDNLRIRGGSAGIDANGPSGLTDGDWALIEGSATKTGGVEARVDGVVVASDPTTSFNLNLQGLRVGDDAGGVDDYYGGRWTEIALLEGTLTVAERANLVAYSQNVYSALGVGA